MIILVLTGIMQARRINNDLCFVFRKERATLPLQDDLLDNKPVRL